MTECDFEEMERLGHCRLDRMDCMYQSIFINMRNAFSDKYSVGQWE